MSASPAPKRRIRAVTLIQPWAHLIAELVKPVENRTWRPHGLAPGDFLAIHAGVWSGPKTEREWCSALELAEQHNLVASIPVLEEFRKVVDGERGRLYRQRCSRYCQAAVTYGAIVAVATLDEVRTEARVVDGKADPWFGGPVGWYLRGVVRFDPVPCTGAQGLWSPEEATLAVVRERYLAARGVELAQSTAKGSP